MGPFPHDAAPATISEENPMGTDGFAFVEFADPEPERLHALFRTLGFAALARHRARRTTLYRQGDVDFLVTEEPDSHAGRFAAAHGPSVPAMGFRVVDAEHAYRRALALGARPAAGERSLAAPAIEGIGGSLLYFVDRDGRADAPYGGAFAVVGRAAPAGLGLHYIDHLTHNVRRGEMDRWTDFYRRLFNFRQVRYFDIEGKLTGLHSRALASPEGRIRIPINESADEQSQIEEFIARYKGEGIQHVALGCRDAHRAVEGLRANGLPFMPAPPDTYYERVDARLPGHGEDLARLRRNGLLIDGTGRREDGSPKLLLQVFSATVIGPVFFELIERKGDDGFGEGNFRALFESIEEDQIRRGAIAPRHAA
jgi:4-hydroxyphenylpyruvate dioxygenase